MKTLILPTAYSACWDSQGGKAKMKMSTTSSGLNGEEFNAGLDNCSTLPELGGGGAQ